MANEIRDAVKVLMAQAALPTGWLSDTVDIPNAVTAALARYARTVPRTIVEKFTGTGASYYVLDDKLSAAWVDATCQVRRVAPAWTLGDPGWLDGDDWEVVPDPANSGKHTLLLNCSPAATDTVVVEFTAPWDDSATVRADHRQAVASLAAATCCRGLAARLSPGTAPTIGADTFMGATQASQYLALAKQFERAYAEAVGEPAGGLDAAGVAAASAEMSYDRGSLGPAWQDLVGFDGTGD